MKTYGCFIVAAVLVILLCLAYGFSVAAEVADSAVVVNISGSAFSPEVVSIEASEEVVWKNKDSAVHTVTANDGSFDSGALSQGDEFRKKFPSAGVITYSCDNHAWMKGKIEVH